MKSLLLSFAALGTVAALAAGSSTPATPAPALHCQIPCGVYGDRMRIEMLMEDAATIEKGMKTLASMAGDGAADHNQTVRWIMNKDTHAQNIQDTVASYWLAQRIKVPTDGTDKAAIEKYHAQLGLLHRITVTAMKCKQTVDLEHVSKLRKQALAFSATYFTAEDLEHIKSHHAGE